MREFTSQRKSSCYSRMRVSGKEASTLQHRPGTSTCFLFRYLWKLLHGSRHSSDAKRSCRWYTMAWSRRSQLLVVISPLRSKVKHVRKSRDILKNKVSP